MKSSLYTTPCISESSNSGVVDLRLHDSRRCVSTGAKSVALVG